MIQDITVGNLYNLIISKEDVTVHSLSEIRFNDPTIVNDNEGNNYTDIVGIRTVILGSTNIKLLQLIDSQGTLTSVEFAYCWFIYKSGTRVTNFYNFLTEYQTLPVHYDILNCIVESEQEEHVAYKGTYDGTIVADDDFTFIGGFVTIKVNGVDVTSSTYDNKGNIHIENITGNVEIIVKCVEQTSVDVTKEIDESKVDVTDLEPTALLGGTYEGHVDIIDYDEDYISEIIVTMGNEQIPVEFNSSEHNEVYFTIDLVTAPITIVVRSSHIPTITTNYVGVTGTNIQTSCRYNANYLNTLSYISGYTDMDIQVTMGGTDITNQVFVEEYLEVYIQNVTGDVVITARAREFNYLTIFNHTGELVLLCAPFIEINDLELRQQGNNFTLIINKEDTYTYTDTIEHTFIGLAREPNSNRISIRLGDNTVFFNSGVTFYMTDREVQPVPETFTMVLYQNQAEMTEVNKLPKLTLIDTLTGTLRNQCSVTLPSIDIELEELPTFNYVYIREFNRYYFVTSVTSVKKNIWNISLKVDVLMSYQEEIYSQTALISRQEFDYNVDLVDSERLVQSDYTVTKYDIDETLFTIDSTRRNVNNNVLVTAQWFESEFQVEYVVQNDFNNLTSIVDKPKGYTRVFTPLNSTYLIKNSQIKDVTKLLIQNNFKKNELFREPSDFIIAFHNYPFELDKWTKGVDNAQVCVGVGALGTITGKRVEEVRLNNFDVTIDRYFNNFMDFAPYTKVRLYIPYISYIDLPTNLVMGKTVRVWLLLEIASGLLSANIEVLENGVYKLIMTKTTSVGIDLPIGRSNATERARNKEIQHINNTVGVVSAVANIGAGVAKMATGNPSGASNVLSGISTGVNTLVSNRINQIQNSQETYSGGNITGDIVGSVLPQRSFLLITRPNPVPIDANYNHLKGVPLGEYRTLGSLQGYTIIDEVHLQGFGSATDGEIQEIENLMRNGIHL